MIESPVVSVRTAVSVLAYSATRGVDPTVLLAEADIDPTLTADPDGRVAHSAMTRLWTAAAARCGEPDLGLRMGQWLQPEEYHDVLGYACRSSPTLGDAYGRAARYFALVHQQVELALIEDGDVAVLRLRPAVDLGAPRHPVECALATLLLLARRALGQEVRPRAVRFRHETPTDTAAHLAFFGVAPRFGAADNELALPRALLAAPLPHGDARLAALLDRQAEDRIAALPTPGGVADRARAAVAVRLQQGEPALEEVAAALRLSPRSLQRHLQEVGISYRGVVDAVRRDEALHHLGEGRLSLAEIAFLLGFAEVSAFHRAFRRWTGRTPASYRPARQA